ncbi:MAG: cytochrome c biogenesis protein CcsA [Alphaproteobacteria bacterium]
MTIRRFISLLLLTAFLSLGAGICLPAIGIAADSNEAGSAEKADYATFNLLPILDEGRIKPLGSFAQITLQHFSGQNRLSHSNASQWLAETLFDPASAIDIPVFLVENSFVRESMGLTGPRRTLYSLHDLQNGLEATAPQIGALLQRQDSALSEDEKALIQLHDNVIAHNNLLRSLSLLLPLQVDIPARYQGGLPEGDVTFLHLAGYEQRILQDLKSIIAAKGEDPRLYTPEEQKIAALAFQMQQIRAGGAHSESLRILPLQWENRKGEWISPWAVITGDGGGGPDMAAYLALWGKMADSWRAGDAAGFKAAAQETFAYVQARTPGAFNLARFRVENLSRTLKPFNIALGLYGLSLFLLSGLLFGAFFSRGRPWILAAACILTGVALFLHASGIATRIYILARPPVGTLYESALFVSLICAASGLIVTLRSRQALSLLTGTACAALILGIAPTLLQKTDSLELLVAVLNTNFWLATHVVCITAGYGVCVLTAALAHIWLALKIWKPEHEALRSLPRILHSLSLVALLLTAVGTVLGGIWADQSWGRFWGWDPKENGALLIVLWLVWLQHGRMSGRLRAPAFTAGLAALNVIVALAWFWVNLLSVGLHSYGFISGIAEGLAAFCTAELTLIGTLWWGVQCKERQKRKEKTA